MEAIKRNGKASPHCAASGCKHRSGEWPHCFDPECNGRYIFVTHVASICEDKVECAMKDPLAGMECLENLADDVAKERWEVVSTKADYQLESTHGRYIDLGGDIPVGVAFQMAAAPEMLEVLEDAVSLIAKYMSSEAELALYNRVRCVIKKARGGE